MPQSKPEVKVAAFECGRHPASRRSTCMRLLSSFRLSLIQLPLFGWINGHTKAFTWCCTFSSVSGWTPVVQSCAESFDRDCKWWAAWSCHHSRLHRPHQDLAGSDRPGGGLLFCRVSTLHVTTVQCQRQLVSDCKCSQNLWFCKYKDLKCKEKITQYTSSRSEPVRGLCAH